MELSFVYVVVLLAAIVALGVAVYYLQARWRQAERDKRIQQILYNLSRALASNFSQEAVLQGLAQSLSSVIRVSRIGVILFENGRGILYGVHDERGKLPALPYPLDLQLYPELREVLWSPKILYIREVSTNPLFSGVKERIGFSGITSLLVVPLNHHGRAFGALTLAQLGKVREFSPAEVELCEAVAASASIALANRELFEQLSNQAREVAEKHEELLDSYRAISLASEELQRSYQELQKTQQKLLDQEKLKVIIELAYATAHEINQPLAALSLVLEMMKDKFSGEEEVKQKIELALEQTYRVAEVVKKLGELESYQTIEYLHGHKMIDLGNSTTKE